MENSANLTGKQKKFCEEYILDFNGARAARAAGYSENTDRSIASELLTKPDIQAEIKRLQANLSEILGITKAMVLNEHKKMAFSSIAHMHNTWITRKEFDQLTDDQKSCIKSIATKVTVEKDAFGNPVSWEHIKVELYDKQKSLDSLSKMLGFNEADKLELSGKSQVVKIGGQEISFD